MAAIKRIPPDDFSDLVTIADQAYPALASDSPEAKNKLAERLKEVQMNNSFIHYYGYYDQNKLKGIMRFHDFSMTYHREKIKAAGIGMVGVDLLYKKEKIAKQMLEYFMDFYHQKGVHMVSLYPFRPDFYKKMGFGFGTNQYRYRVKPSSFPYRGDKSHLTYLTMEDLPRTVACYNQYADRTHGCFEKREYELEKYFTDHKTKVIGFEKDGKLEGYLVFSFKQADDQNFLVNDMEIKEWVYLNREAFHECCTFLHTQKDQINRIVLDTQDEYVHFLLSDPRNDSGRLIPSVFHETSTAGTGVMYRVIDAERIFNDLQNHNFNGADCTVTFQITDTFFPKNDQEVTVYFHNGYPTVMAGAKGDVEVKLDIADFSSLLMGAVPFEKLYWYGLAEISDQSYAETLQHIFFTHQKPICLTSF